MKLIVGLGNPGKEYINTRHNIGWMFLQYLENKYNFKIFKKALDSNIVETNLFNQKVVFAKPQTYMNLSGNAVQKLKKWYKLDNSDIVIIYDDIDISFGTTRYRECGSGGTHNGMKNIVQMLSTQDIARIRIGIGGIKHDNQDLINFVLEKFNKEQLDVLQNNIFVDVEEKLKIFLDK
ncbi:MAG: aminoacyl-tRNA hydrolase [Clostridia bacterium]